MKAITQVQPDKPCVAHKGNLETLRMAFANDDVALVEVQIKATGERVAALCALQKNGAEVEIVPFAVMLNGNPYELLNPPNPDGGFFQQET